MIALLHERPQRPATGNPTGARLAGLSLLAGTGVLAVVVHQAVDLSLKIPGHQGVFWIALVVLARVLSGERWAATVAAAGAAGATLVPMLGVHEVLSGWHYLLTGAVLDVLWRASGRSARPLALALIGAVAFATNPVSKWLLVQALGLPYGSVASGVGWPVATHLAFGFAGAMIGAHLALAARRARH